MLGVSAIGLAVYLTSRDGESPSARETSQPATTATPGEASAPPRAPLDSADEPIRDLTALMDRACTCRDTACTDAVMNDFMELGKKHKDTKGSDADVETFKRIFERMQECIAKVAETRPTEPPPTSSRRGAETTGLPACDSYIEAMEKYLACDKIPQATRDAARQGIEAMKQGWGDVERLPQSVKEQANDACRSSVDALHQGARALGCPL